MVQERFFSDITRKFDGLLDKEVISQVFREVDAIYQKNNDPLDRAEVKILTYQRHVDLLEQRLQEAYGNR